VTCQRVPTNGRNRNSSSTRRASPISDIHSHSPIHHETPASGRQKQPSTSLGTLCLAIWMKTQTYCCFRANRHKRQTFHPKPQLATPHQHECSLPECTRKLCHRNSSSTRRASPIAAIYTHNPPQIQGNRQMRNSTDHTPSHIVSHPFFPFHRNQATPM